MTAETNEAGATLVATVALSITRDPMTILPVTVTAHELPIQQAIFGEDNVEILDTKSEPVAVAIEGETERLEQRYGTGALEKAYGVNFKTGIKKAVAESVAAAKPGKPGKKSDTPAE